MSKCCLSYTETEQTKSLCLLKPAPPPPPTHCTLPHKQALLLWKTLAPFTDCYAHRPAIPQICVSGRVWWDSGNGGQSPFRKMSGNLKCHIPLPLSLSLSVSPLRSPSDNDSQGFHSFPKGSIQISFSRRIVQGQKASLTKSTKHLQRIRVLRLFIQGGEKDGLLPDWFFKASKYSLKAKTIKDTMIKMT